MIPKKQIVDLPVYQPGKPIDEVKNELGLDQIVKLASNENPFGSSPKVKEIHPPLTGSIGDLSRWCGYGIKRRTCSISRCEGR